LPYSSIIPNEILLGIKRKNKNKIYCTKHNTEKLSLLHGQRICIICNKKSRKKSSQKYLAKKVDQKSKKFQFFGVS
tara:strand:+ start:396 stop:623 length:228 start_codon:yes stop_codon:yes gene_type:complete